MRALRWAAAVAVTGAAVLLVAGASHVRAQVPPITLPGQTTTTEGPPPPVATTEAPATTTPPDTTETTAPDTTATSDTLPAGTPVPVPAVGGSDTTVAPPTTVAARVTPTRAVTTVDLASGIKPASVTGAYGIGLAALISMSVLLISLTTHVRSFKLSHGGSSMTTPTPAFGRVTNLRRGRLIAGFACLALAAIVGLVGYLKLSLEPDVNRQIPYLASAGMALVLLSALGGALVVGEQMRTDEQRIVELEAAVHSLAAIVSPTVEAPPRHGAPAIVESAAADAAEAAEAAVSKPRRRRS
ncbi:MAG TPA: hypothetical protein VFA83_15140 [Acidimicrobiales bacterium]|nr:hypothetical protein [Acidimicrobiales bacterium]